MSELCFCPTCMEVYPARISQSCGVVVWTCTNCGNTADEDYDLVGPYEPGDWRMLDEGDD